MIGVIANPEEEHVVREFFELFKTPWEFHRKDGHYDVVVCTTTSNLMAVDAKLLVVYSGHKTSFDAEHNVHIQLDFKSADISFAGARLPIYGRLAAFRCDPSLLTERGSGLPAMYANRCGERISVHVGYDLFGEIERLLSKGQPPENAAVPALDLHIKLLRDLITHAGIPLVEIPPVPAGYSFIACLTHDLDHACIRRHMFDSTAFGFLYRATLGSAAKAARGRLSLQKLFSNWAAAAKLPFIYSGLARDIWNDFDRYLDLEKGRPSTFFVIPFENRPGHSPNGTAPRARATRYGAAHIRDKILRLAAAGCEIGLHGIDAWYESLKGREEAGRVSQVSNCEVSGVRMHWLYSDERSARVLEQAGFLYDSTAGYNNTIGYRAGTAQVFKPLGATRLLELPMHIMDTALFYPDYLNLSETEAWNWVAPMFNHSTVHGGAVTVNWHDRSIAPERLWGDFYVRLVDELTSRRAWFCTASQAVLWFQKRRSATFQAAGNADGIQINIAEQNGDGLPGFRLRVHQPRTFSALGQEQKPFERTYSDTVLTGNMQFSFFSPSLN